MGHLLFFAPAPLRRGRWYLDLIALLLLGAVLALGAATAYRSPRFAVVAIADPLDRAELRDFHSLERSAEDGRPFRWTSDDDSALSLPNPGGRTVVQLLLAGGPRGTLPIAVDYGRGQPGFDVAPELRRYALLLPPAQAERITLRLLVQLADDPYSSREIGVVVGDARVAGGGAAPALLLAALLLAGALGYAALRQLGGAPLLAAALIGGALLAVLGWQGLGAWSAARLTPLLWAFSGGLAALQAARWLLSGARPFVFTLAVAMLVAGAVVHMTLWSSVVTSQDIYPIWREGQRLIAGENPYARALAGNPTQNEGYPTYFPLFYLLAALTSLLGAQSFESWLALWRVLFLGFNLGIAALIFYALYRRGHRTLALFGMGFWLFSRWTINVTGIAHIDFIPIFFLLLALLLLRSRPRPALLLFGVSLAVKQIAIFLLPLIVIWAAWPKGAPASGRGAARQLVQAAALALLVPLVVALPFLVWNAEGFASSVLFSVTRFPASHGLPGSLDVVLQEHLPWFVGPLARLPMLFLMGLLTLAAWERRLGPFVGSALMVATFIDFNSVLFVQYFAWLAALLPLVVCDAGPVCAGQPPEPINREG